MDDEEGERTILLQNEGQEALNSNLFQSYIVENEIETSFVNNSWAEQQLEKPTCVWHDEIQASLNKVNELVTNHKQRSLTEEQSMEDQEIIKKFVDGGKKGRSMWKRIEKFFCKPAVFMMKDLKIYIEDDLKRKHPNISDKVVKEKMNNLINNIENQIREDFKLKYYKLSEQEIEEKVRGVKVKGYLSGDREKYLSDKAEFIVEEAIVGKIGFNKPGLLRRGLKTDKRTYQHLKNILGEVTPNCLGKLSKKH